MNNKMTEMLQRYSDKMNNYYHCQSIMKSFIISDDVRYMLDTTAYNLAMDDSHTDVTIDSLPHVTSHVNYKIIDNQNYAALFIHDTLPYKEATWLDEETDKLFEDDNNDKNISELFEDDNNDEEELSYSHTVILSPTVDDLIEATKVYVIAHLNKFQLLNKAMEFSILKTINNSLTYTVNEKERLVIDGLIVGNVAMCNDNNNEQSGKVIDQLNEIAELPLTLSSYANAMAELPDNNPSQLNNDNDKEM